MEFTVSTEALLETTNCSKSYSCLSTGQCGDSEPCNVISTNGTGYLFLESDKSKKCRYQLPFFNKTICTCPVHFELFSKYNV